jgi:hypothetical protein
MKKLKELFQVNIEGLKKYDLVEVSDKRVSYLSLKVLKPYTKKMLSVLDKNTHLIRGEVMLNLFESDSIKNHIDKKWLYSEKEFTGKDPADLTADEVTELFLNYIDGNETQYEAQDFWFKEKMKQLKAASNEEILSAMVFGIRFDDNRGSIELDKITSENGKLVKAVASKINYAKIATKVREVYSIENQEPIDMDDFIYTAATKYFQGMCGDKNYDQELIDQLAYAAQSAGEFKESIKEVLRTCTNPPHSEKEVTFVMRDGLNASGTYSFENPSMNIYLLGVVAYYQGHKKEESRHIKLVELKEDAFWKEVWNECGRFHEEQLLRKIKEEEKTEVAYASKCSSKYYMTLGEIQKVLQEKYGVTLTETAIGAIVKKALMKLEISAEEKGLSLEDIEEESTKY